MEIIFALHVDESTRVLKRDICFLVTVSAISLNAIFVKTYFQIMVKDLYAQNVDVTQINGTILVPNVGQRRYIEVIISAIKYYENCY